VEHLTFAEAADRLTRARASEVSAIAAAVEDHQVVGITGPAESGKTKLLRLALVAREVSSDAAVLMVDLDGVRSSRHLAQRWLRAVARAVAGPIAFSHMVGLQRDVWPGQTRHADHEAREVLRSDYELALSARGDPGPAGDEDPMERALAATSRLRRMRPTTVVVDHLEAPELSGAFDVRDLLWKLRAVTQRKKDMSVVLVCRPGAVDVAADEDAAFFGDGTWLTIAPPGVEIWTFATDGWDRIERICELTHGHIWSTAMLVDRVSKSPRLSAARAFATLATEQEPLAARCVQHAASLHRLGPALLLGIANGLGPYQAAPEAQSRDVALAARRLELAGLAYRPQQRVWRIVNPLVARALHDPDVARTEQR
jgi:hypothetical protein